MEKSFFACPRCCQSIKVEAEGKVLAVKHPDDGEPLTSDDNSVQTNQPSIMNENRLESLVKINAIEKELLRRIKFNQGEKPELIDMLCEASKGKLEILNKFG